MTEFIRVGEDDDVASISRALATHDSGRFVLLFPSDSWGLLPEVDLVRIARRARRSQQQLAVVYGSERSPHVARRLGFAVFRSTSDARRNEKEWARAAKVWNKSPGTESPRLLAVADIVEVRKREQKLTDWQVWLGRYVSIFTFALTIAVAASVLFYVAPSARITFHPTTTEVTSEREVLVDPFIGEDEATASVIPGEALSVLMEWSAEGAATGTTTIPDSPARGSVVFINQLSQPVQVAAGTRVTTSAGRRIVFQTEKPVVVPGAVGATAQVAVVAVDAGLDGNVPANRINRIEGSLSISLRVVNTAPTGEGSEKEAPTLTAEDKNRLRGLIHDQLLARGANELHQQLIPGQQLIAESLRIIYVERETFSHFEGEVTSRFVVEIRALVGATALDNADATAAVEAALAAVTPTGYELTDNSMKITDRIVIEVDGSGRASMHLVGTASAAATLPLESLIETVSGQRTETAVAYLFENLPLRSLPEVELTPYWFSRIPYLPVRVTSVVDSGE